MKQSILVLCTGNSCRSQMAEGFLRSFDPELDVHSAGTVPATEVHPLAVQVMREKEIDLSANRPKKVDEFLAKPFDYVVTVCDGAKESCPLFIGQVRHRVHIGFDDPAAATGSDDEVLALFRRVRDEIEARFGRFYRETIRGENHE